MKISIIGAGNMGGAIARGLSKGSFFSGSDITISDINQVNLQKILDLNVGINCTDSNRACVHGAEIVVLAVKPWLVDSIAAEIRDLLNYNSQIIISIAAGVPLEKLRTLFSGSDDQVPTLFRMIPNTAIDAMESFSCISSWNATQDQEEQIVKIFDELGKAMLVPESQLNAFMSLSSCGIAYALRYIRAATEGGVEMGIYPNVAQEVVLQTLKGAVALLEGTGNHPEVEIDKVTTAGGVTIKGLNEMEHAGFTSAVIRGLKASHLG
ncbi:MAG TPA: pyrroline-5-carboxylate reductase [Bacteroidales bacterium]|nr:pyrroline-5-carboxylate reductase [Bacteroidales bacterium]